MNPPFFQSKARNHIKKVWQPEIAGCDNTNSSYDDIIFELKVLSSVGSLLVSPSPYP